MDNNYWPQEDTNLREDTDDRETAGCVLEGMEVVYKQSVHMWNFQKYKQEIIVKIL